MSKTKFLGGIIIVGALAGAATDYLQGNPVNYTALAERVSAGLSLIFLRDGIQKAITAAAAK